MQKALFFAAALSDRSFRASQSSLKRDVNNSTQGSNAKSANGTVAQTSGGALTQRMMSMTVPIREITTFDFSFFFGRTLAEVGKWKPVQYSSSSLVYFFNSFFY